MVPHGNNKEYLLHRLMGVATSENSSVLAAISYPTAHPYLFLTVA